MKLGVSLLFYKKTENTREGMMQSYVIDVNPLREKNIKKLVNNILSAKTIEQGFGYVGIEDLFYVGGGLSEGNLLGRTTYYEYNTRTLGRKLVKGRLDRSVSGNDAPDGVKYFNASLVYYYADPEDRSDSFSVIVITIVKASSYKLAISRIKEVAVSSKLRKQIIKSDLVKLTSENLHFLGVNELAPIHGNIKNGDAYRTHYNESIKSRRELTKMLLSTKKIEKKIEVFKENR